MIKFFRKIRFELMGKNNTGNPAEASARSGKYFKYAVGEIALVVIGILIALQINNANQNRINANEELKILKALKIGLETDREDILFNIGRIESSMLSANKVIFAIEKNMPYNDSIADYMGLAMFPVLFVNSTSAFETLKSKGIDVITNTKLRDEIIGVYDSGYNFFLSFEAITLEENERGLKEIFPSRFEASYVYNLEKPNLQPRLVPLDYESLKNDQEFNYYLKSYTNRLNILLNFQYKNRLLLIVNSLITNLEYEINQLEN